MFCFFRCVNCCERSSFIEKLNAWKPLWMIAFHRKFSKTFLCLAYFISISNFSIENLCWMLYFMSITILFFSATCLVNSVNLQCSCLRHILVNGILFCCLPWPLLNFDFHRQLFKISWTNLLIFTKMAQNGQMCWNFDSFEKSARKLWVRI